MKPLTPSQSAQHVPNASVEKPTEDEVHRKPWKHIGYKGYSEFVSSEDDFFLLRRFDTLNTRVALALQDEVSQLEEELGEFDQATSHVSGPDFNNGTLRGDLESRSVLIRKIAGKLGSYNELLLQQTSLRKYPKAPNRNIRSVRNWHHNHDYSAISREEQRYLSRDDLVSVVHTEKTPLRQAIDRSHRLRTLFLWRHRENETPGYDAEEVSHYSDKRIDAFASAVIISVGVAMLITPIWVLEGMVDLKGKLAVITCFIFVFLLVLSLAMVAKPFEALGATAAYAAVLMVFLQVDS